MIADKFNVLAKLRLQRLLIETSFVGNWSWEQEVGKKKIGSFRKDENKKASLRHQEA